MFVALEWDHHIGKPMVQWIVVECDHVKEKYGGPQAMPPRRDVAYFCDPVFAQRDAVEFAAARNAAIEAGSVLPPAMGPRHAAFAWDHQIFGGLIKWAVLRWNGGAERQDIAYFLDPQHAERDARQFRYSRDVAMEEYQAEQTTR